MISAEGIVGMIGADDSFVGEPPTKHAMQDWSNYLTRSALFLRQGRRIPHVRGTPLPQIGACGFDGEKLTRPASDILGIDELSR